MPSRSCPVCSASVAQATVFLENSISQARLSTFSFASRKTPEFMSHRLVHCSACDLVYADEPPDQKMLAHAYHVADFNSTEEAEDAAHAYLKALQPGLAQLNSRRAALEIGAGTGIFLDLLRQQGFDNAIGVEPSSAAIAAAPSYRRAWIRESIFNEDDFEAASFDFICCFMTLEHVRDPGDLARSVMRLLRPGGMFAVVVHDHRAWVNRLLGRYSPIIDIEHMQLFSRESISSLLKGAGLDHVQVQSFRNRYALTYWLRLAPGPQNLKRGLMQALNGTYLGKKKLGINVGNMLAHGLKP